MLVVVALSLIMSLLVMKLWLSHCDNLPKFSTAADIRRLERDVLRDGNGSHLPHVSPDWASRVHITFKTPLRDIPSKVKENWARNLDGFVIQYSQDADCVKFLQQHFSPQVVELWHKLPLGAFRADLWRYCTLYVYGGVYQDVKIEWLVPLRTVVPDLSRGVCTTVRSIIPGSIFQGLLAAPPRRPIFLALVHKMLHTPILIIKAVYLTFTRQMWSAVMADTVNGSTWELLQEKRDSSRCNGTTRSSDFSGQCVHIEKDGIVVANTRFDDFKKTW